MDYKKSHHEEYYCGWCGFDEDCKCNDEDVTGCLTCGVMLTPEEMEEHLEDVKQREMEDDLAEKAKKDIEKNIQENNA